MNGEAAPEVTILLPCRNEAQTIGGCVRDAAAAARQYGYDAEVLVVDNDSDDYSAEEAERAGARVVRQPIRGYGAAVLRGFEEARGEIVLVVDADGTYDMSVLNRFVEPIRSGYDMVLGTRRNGQLMPRSMGAAHRHFLEPVQTYLSRRFLHFTVSDLRCGMRAVRRTVLPRLRLGATGMELASEMLIAAARNELRVMEVPVQFQPRAAGRQRRSVGDGWRVMRQLLLLSPSRLFIVPGVLLLLLGLGLEIALLPGPIRLTDTVNLDFHFLFVGGALAILGLQLLLLGLYAKTYALVHDAGPADPWMRRFHLHYSLERAVALGGALIGAGLIVDVWILAEWLAAGRGVLFAVRPAMLALTLMVMGTEIVFAAFFLSLLRSSGFGRT